MALLAQSMEALTAGLDLHTSLARFADLLVPYPADWVAVHLIEDDGTVVRAVLRHTDPTRVERLVGREQGVHVVPGPVADTLGTGRPVLLSEIPDNLLAGLTAGGDVDAAAELGLHSAVVVPLLRPAATCVQVLPSSDTATRYALLRVAPWCQATAAPFTARTAPRSY